MKDFGRLQAYANPSHAGNRGPQAVGYGNFGVWPLVTMREVTHGAYGGDADGLVMGGIERFLPV